MTRREAVKSSLMRQPTVGVADIFNMDTYRRLKRTYSLPNEPIVKRANKKKTLSDRERQRKNLL